MFKISEPKTEEDSRSVTTSPRMPEIKEESSPESITVSEGDPKHLRRLSSSSSESEIPTKKALLSTEKNQFIPTTNVQGPPLFPQLNYPMTMNPFFYQNLVRFPPQSGFNFFGI